MRELELVEGAGARAWGRAHGEHFREAIGEITEIREALALEQGQFESVAEVREVAGAHLEVLRAFDTALYEELIGIADGARIEPARVVVLNHYTDLKDIRRGAINRDEECTSLVAGTAEGPVLAQTWDMHGSAEPYVCALAIPARDGAPAVRAFTITGCLALAGMNSAGLGVAINNLKSHDARVGVVWPALIRRLLVERSVATAKHVLMTAPMSSGHHYLLCDERSACAIETSGERKAIAFERAPLEPSEAFIHTNHCLAESLEEVSWVSDWSTSYERYAWLEASVAERPIESARDAWKRLGSHDGYPRSVCTHLASEENPHAMKTCGAIAMLPCAREVWMVAGCVHESAPLARGFGG